MPPLKNNRHEKFALALFKGMSQQDAAIKAGYKLSRARKTASRLVTYGDIEKRIAELHKRTATTAIMDVKERKERLSQLAREEIKKPLTGKEVVSSVAELNKMEGEYAPSRVVVDSGETMSALLSDLLLRLRGYDKKDMDPEPEEE